MKAQSMLFLSLALLTAAGAAPKVQVVEYKQDTVVLEGVLVSDSVAGLKPGIVLFSDWMGVSEWARTQAGKMARMGYVVFVGDVYGKGRSPKNDKEAAALSTSYKSNRPLMRQRAAAALARLKASPGVDTTRIGAMGFCFGGTVALELARSGADLDGTATVHGNLDTPDPSMAKNIKGTVLALHGANDPYVPADQVRNFQDEMRNAKVDWYMTTFGGAVHSFTKPEAGNDPSKGQAFNPKADARAFEELRDFYADAFAPKASKK